MALATASFLLQGDALPADVNVVRYRAREAISTPYEVEVDFFSFDASFDVSACLSKPLLLTVVNEDGDSRNFYGVVDRASFTKVSGPKFYFRVRLRPALAALAHREDSRIFQEKSLIDIATKIFEDAGFAASVKWQITGDYQPLDFVVQYRESELDFLARHFADNGIFYFFEQTANGHTLIVSDDSEHAFVPMGDAPSLLLSLAQGGQDAKAIDQFRRTRSLRTMHVTLRDFDFEKPGAAPEAEQPGSDAWPMTYYEYPGGFVKSADGKRLATARLEQLRRDADTCSGTSTAIGLRCGVPFSVEGAAEDCLNGDFVVTELASEGKQDPESEKTNFACRNSFRGIPLGALHAPAPVSKRPRIHGVQTALVTGPSTDDQAIHTDKYGRIKVRFHWDRINQQDDTSSCWVRVSQPPMSGSIILPRVGWEVTVAFLGGDPDRPVVLGRVYNAEKTLPYALPGAKASGSLKSHSSPGGGGHNEIMMSDSGGSQGYGMHAQKDLNITIGHDKKEKILANETHDVHTNINRTVGVDEITQVTGNQSIDVGAVLSCKVGGSQALTVGGNDTSNATSNYVEKVGGNRDYTVTARQMTLQNAIKCTVTGDFTREIGAVEMNGSVASISDNILGDYNSTVGAATMHLIKGSHGETVSGSKKQLCGAAEIHVVKGSLSQSCDAGVTNLVGGLHYEKIDGAYSLKAPMISLVGAIGVFKGGDSVLKLGGGPIVIQGSAISSKGAMIVRMSGALKMGSGG